MSSFFIALAKKSAAEEFFANSDGLREIVAQAVIEDEQREAEDSRYDFPEFKLNINAHLKKDNRADAVGSMGCGCALCLARFNNATASRNISWFKKCYQSDFNHHYFEELYIREYDTYGPEHLSKSVYYDIKLEEFKSFYDVQHERYLKVKQAMMNANLINKKDRLIMSPLSHS